MQDKKRQLFAAIQEREQLKERARQAEAKLKEYQDVMHCRLCHSVGVKWMQKRLYCGTWQAHATRKCP